MKGCWICLIRHTRDSCRRECHTKSRYAHVIHDLVPWLEPCAEDSPFILMYVLIIIHDYNSDYSVQDDEVMALNIHQRVLPERWVDRENFVPRFSSSK